MTTMKKVKVEVWSDFVCPFCLIAEHPLRQAVQAVQATGVQVEIEWMPFELRPHPTPTLRPEDPYLQTVWPQSVYPLARRFGVELTLPSVSPQPHSALAWQGYQHAKTHGLGAAYNEAVLRAFFQQDLDIGRHEVLAGLAAGIGLDARDFTAALQDGRHREAHAQALAQAQAEGVNSVPAFRIGRRRLTGVQDAQVLAQALVQAQHEAAEG